MKFEKELKKSDTKKSVSKKTLVVVLVGIAAVSLITLPLLLGGLQ